MNNSMLGQYDALLVQDVSHLYHAISHVLNRALEYYQHEGVTEEDAFNWIVREEIEKIYHVFDDEHVKNRESQHLQTYRKIHESVTVGVDRLLSQWVAHLIKVPNLFNDPRTNFVVSIRIIHFQDIQIWYNKHPLLNWQYISGHQR